MFVHDYNDDDDDAQAILGRGIDNHLLGLRQIAEQCAMKTPTLFVDGSYQTSNHFTLSTSQVKLWRLIVACSIERTGSDDADMMFQVRFEFVGRNDA